MSEVFSIFADTIKDLAISSGIANMSWKGRGYDPDFLYFYVSCNC